jgi:hypothetical protein
MILHACSKEFPAQLLHTAAPARTLLLETKHILSPKHERSSRQSMNADAHQGTRRVELLETERDSNTDACGDGQRCQSLDI